MYRQRYPDAPGLFSSSQRGTYYRPPLRTVFRRTWLASTLGILLTLAGVLVFVDNERRAVLTSHALTEGYRQILVPETTEVVFEENNGKLVLVSGELSISEGLSDPTYGISVPAVKLKKWVQMYQWFEEADVRESPPSSAGGGGGPDDHTHTETTYSYAMDWFDKPIDSLSFQNSMGHDNPQVWPVNSSLTVSSRVKIGNFLLGGELKDKFNRFTPFTSDERPQNPNIKMHAGLYFHAKNVWESEVGDVRVQFSYAGKHGDTVTVVGRQSGREIRPYYSESGSKEPLLFLYYGYRTAEDVFQSEHSQNRMRTWAFRIGAWIATFVGLNFVAHLLEMIVDEYPYVRTILVMRITSIPFSLSMSLMLVSTGLSWIVYRPLWGLLMTAIALAPICLAAYRVRQRRKAQERHTL